MSGHSRSWAAALQQLSINGTHLSAEEVVDACLLVTLSERVHVLSFDPDGEAPQRLSRYLHGLGYSVCPLYHGAPAAVAAPDTVIAFVGSNPPDVRSLLRSVRVSGAVLIAITTPDAGPIPELGDAVVTLPSLTSTTAGPLRPMVFDLLASIVVEAIGRELTGRLHQSPGALFDDSTSPGSTLYYNSTPPGFARHCPAVPA